jgi:hypothetical protein
MSSDTVIATLFGVILLLTIIWSVRSTRNSTSDNCVSDGGVDGGDCGGSDSGD